MSQSTNPFKQQKIIDRLTTENARLREQNKRLRDMGLAEKAHLFAREKEQAVLFAMKAIELRTMEAVADHLAPKFRIPADALIVKAFRDCLRLSMHMIDPRRAANLYNALKLQNPDRLGSVPSVEQVDALLREHADRVQVMPEGLTRPKAILLDASAVSAGPRKLFVSLRELERVTFEQQGPKDISAELKACIKAAEECPDHPAAVFLSELCEAIDDHAEGIGGHRPERTILHDALNAFLLQAIETETTTGANDAPAA